MKKLRLFSLAFAGTLLFSQVPHPRPRVALVLEGGGALGFAHVGVIDYLEQNHIPVDLVVGTSMGGLVGGLYAIGKTPAEIHRLTQEIDWDSVLGGRTAFQDLNYRRKEDREAFPNPLDLGLRHKRFNFPAGLNSGHQTGLVIDRATLAYPDKLNFGDLPIAFRCVATDVTLGREKVFDQGSIAQALRATMAIPAVFSPVIIDGHAYSDGGAVNNLPVDVAKRAGADFVIAVYLDPGPADPASYDSMFTVAAKNISIMVSSNELRNMAAADILLRVDLHGFTSSSFKDGEKIIPKGLEAAEKKKQILSTIALNNQDWQTYVEQREAKVKREIAVPQFVEVMGDRPEYNEALKQNLTKFVSKPIEPPNLERTLTRFTGNGMLSSIGYTMTDKLAQPGLEVKTYEKTYGPPFLNLAVTIDGADPDNVLFGMAARLTFLNVGGYRAEWRNDAFFGSTYGARSEYYRPFSGRSKLFFAPRLYALSSTFDEYSGNNRLTQYRLERDGLGADLGYTIDSRSELRAGQDLLWAKTVKKITSDPFPNSSERENRTSLTYRFYGVDNVQIPRSGMNIELDVNRYQPTGGFDSFEQSEIRASYFHPISKPASVFVAASGGTSFNTKTVDLGFNFFTLGGPLRLGAYGQHQLVGNQYFLFQGGYEHKLLSFSPFVGEGLYAIGAFEAGKVYGYQNGVPVLPLDGTLALAARTAIGPVFLGVSVGNGGYRKWWFGVGRIF